MFFVVFFFTLGTADLCPQYPGVRNLYNSVANVTISYGFPFFFYSNYNLLGDVLTIRVRPSTTQVFLVKGNALDCPTFGRDETLLSPHAGELAKIELPLSSELGLQTFMVLVNANTTTDVVISVEGQNPNNADLGQWRLIAILYLTAAIVLLICLFVHAILARGRVHYKVDLSGNE
jgi:hypothetical protein